MSSGEKQLIVSPLERAVAADIVRAQSFLGASLNELLRALLDTSSGLDDVQAGALAIQNLTQGTPAYGKVIGGLLFQPTGGSTAALIGPGIAALYDPDTTPSADDSQYKLVSDPLGTSALTLTANTSGNLRIDVIECARVQPDNVVETDSRDVFNTTTGVYAAATVVKATQAQLQYRIRTGLPGGGMPAFTQGWLPLTIASVPTGTHVWDTVTLWDVRPLLEDRIFNLIRATRDLPKVDRCLAQIDAVNFAGQSRLSGIIEAELGGRRIGGMLRASTPAAASGDSTYYVDLDDAANQDPGHPPAGNGFNYVYLACPYNLPRWARYTVGPNGRVPQSPRGILFASAVSPDLVYGTPTTSLQLPPCLQDNASQQRVATTAAVCVLARLGTQSSGARGLIASGKRHQSSVGTATNNAIISGGTTAIFTLTPGTDFPAHARALHVTMTISYTASGAGEIEQTYAITLPGIGQILPAFSPDGAAHQAVTAAGAWTFTQSLRIPVPSMYGIGNVPGTSTPGDSQAFQIAVGGGGGPLTTTAGTLTVTGWELLDAD